jgi:hypothetical protein
MPVRNIWSFEPGECFTAERLAELGLKVFFPLRDVGVDLLVINRQKHVGIQVKESRYYRKGRWKSGHVGHSWHQIRKKKLEDDVDFYVFLTYEDVKNKHKLGFENRFLIVPKDELMKRIGIKDAGKSRIFSFCFHFDEKGKAYDERVTVSVGDELTDYSQFLEAWDLIKKALT